MRVETFGVGDLVREHIRADDDNPAWNPPDVGLILRWADGGWIVDFPSYGNIFWMNPNNLELVSEAR